jgi:hypothetical protein
MNWLFWVVGLRKRLDGRDQQQRRHGSTTDYGLGHGDCPALLAIELKCVSREIQVTSRVECSQLLG